MLAGITSGLLASNLSPLLAANQEGQLDSDFMKLIQETGGNITFRSLTEEDLLLELNNDGAQLFKSLSPEGQQLALQIASRSCNGENRCAGQNACATSENKCAGQGKCKGRTKCAFSDKNLAVKVAAKIMAEKRQKAFNP